MTIVETHIFPVGREELWRVLHDARQMAKWIPGCERLDEIGGHVAPRVRHHHLVHAGQAAPSSVLSARPPIHV